MHPSRSARRRLRWRWLLVWSLWLSLLGQAAFGCADVHAALCADEVPGLSADDGAGPDACDLACSHCHGGCVHAALAVQRFEPFAPLVSRAPEVGAAVHRSSAPQHPLLRPPARSA